MSDLSRVEQLLRNALGEDIYEVTPQSRVEILLAQLNELIEGLGGSISPEDIATAVAAYLDEHPISPTNIQVDTSLTIAGAAADSKATGDKLSALKSELDNDKIDIPVNINTTIGRVMFAQGDITFNDTNRSFAKSYAELEPNKTYKVHISSGYKMFAVLLESSATTAIYDRSQFDSWMTGEQTITITPTDRWHYFRCSLMRADSGLMTNDDLESIVTLTESRNTIFATKTALAELREDVNNSNQCLLPSGGQILYNADTKASGDYIVNALAYDDGVIIACRANGNVVRIGYDGTEETILSISGSGFDWRLCWKDSNDNVYVSPHASWGSMTAADRGLYKLTKGASAFTKVISLYGASSSVPTESENNDDTIWTMCEDASGNLYAGVYAHTKHANPAIYKSTDGGDTWIYAYNFNTSGLTTGGRHIHAIVYSPWKDALYCIVGEINTIFKSVDGGTTWTNLNITLRVKGSSMLATPNGLLVGSDGAYNCEIDLVYADDKTHETVFSGWANTVFAIRRSDLTGFVYAFTKIDSSVSSVQYMPPYRVLTDTNYLEAWKAGNYTSGVAPAHLAEWEAYNASVKDKYPDDALRPQHFAILVSRNGGSIWEVLRAFPCDSGAAYGIWTIGQFHNGECLCGVYTGNYINGTFVTGVSNPMVISEGKHKYVATGCDLDGEIFVRTNASSIVELI